MFGLQDRDFTELDFTVQPLIFSARISEYIPPRPPIPRQVGGAERAVLEFHNQTANIANMLLDEFRELSGEELSNDHLDDSQKAVDERYGIVCTLTPLEIWLAPLIM